jgi:hypothetical protein
MEREELIAILKQGSLAWNNWRAQHPEIPPPDLTECDLSGMDLVGVNLRGADLTRVRLPKAKLRQANLDEAELTYADLHQADLREATLHKAIVTFTSLDGADLSYANLSYASLVETDLTEAKLCRTNLSNAVLNSSVMCGTLFVETVVDGVDFTNVTMGQTMLIGIDFSKAGGFHSIIHRGPSYASIDTLVVSRDVLPAVFLRGLGIAEPFLPLLQTVSYPEQGLPRGYLIYSQWEQALATRMAADLQQYGLRCWLFQHTLGRSGEWLKSAVDEYTLRMMHQNDLIILFCSQKTLVSQWLQPFLLTVQQREAKVGHTLLVLCQVDQALAEIDTSEVVALRSTYPVVDFTQWQKKEAYEESILQLLIVLQAQSSI